MGEPSVLTEVRGQALLITLNRATVRNAIDERMAAGIASALDALDASPNFLVGVITGAGTSFSAGLDLKAFLIGERPTVEGRGFAGIVERSCEKPLIAAVEGYALGGGFEIALACDLIVASETARFGLPEVRRGLVAGGGGLVRLPARIPYHQAMELAMTGDVLTAERAAELGLVNRVVPGGLAVTTALELAAQIAANAPLAVRMSKRILVESRGWPQEEAFERQRPLVETVRNGPDAREGAAAFAAKRSPDWAQGS
jgi:enoyl-CoA hydratase